MYRQPLLFAVLLFKVLIISGFCNQKFVIDGFSLDYLQIFIKIVENNQL
jgi:hypothetical protein